MITMNKAQEGDKVTVTHQGVLDDGIIFDESDDSVPLTFTLGENEVLPGVEIAVLGMEVGDRKTVTIPPEHGCASSAMPGPSDCAVDLAVRPRLLDRWPSAFR